MNNDPLKGWKITGIAATLVIVILIPIYWVTQESGRSMKRASITSARASFVGSGSCKDCHKKEYDKWADSHHRWAMAPATENTVLGDFNGAVFDHSGVQSRFYRKNGTYYVHTRGPGGRMGDFEVTFTFGWFPLQQYLHHASS